jgi:hypothetical protein
VHHFTLGGRERVQILVSSPGNPGADRYTALTTTTRTENMGWLDYYLMLLFLALVGLLVAKFRG